MSDPLPKLKPLLFLLLSLNAFTQVPEKFPSVEKGEIPNAKILSVRQFTGESLFGYIDGGADLYLEYGFLSAEITEFGILDHYYKCEVFKMKGIDEAFGIYSVSKFRCLSSPAIASFTCQTHFQLQICKGPYYISIINKSGSSTDSLNSIKIGRLISDKIKEPSADLSAFFPGENTSDIQHNAVLVKGKLGLVNGAPDWEDYFRDVSGFYTVILPGGEKTTISVRFDSDSSFRKFCELHEIDSGKLSSPGYSIKDGNVVVLIDRNHLIIKSPAH